jgi:hypothetical protein
MSVLILDSGNSIIKGKIARRERGETAFPHALRALTETEYESILVRAGRSGPPPDYIRVNGQPYVVGQSAERHGTLTRRTGAARYRVDYYGVFVAATLARLYERGGEVTLFGSHPPGDVAFRDDLMGAALGDWHVETGGRERYFRVTYANTFDEPVGGLMNVILSEDGQHYKRLDINGGRALVVDIGGHTTDWLAVNPGGEVDYSLAESTPIGINEVVRNFERSFRANNLDAVRDTPTLPPDRVRDAIASGVFVGAGRTYDCENEVREATSVLLGRIAETYQNVAGGALPWDTLILTGGGSAMLYDRLLPILGHEQVILADDAEGIHLANVRGGLKLWRLYEALGLL